MIVVTTLPGFSMTTLNALLVLPCAVVVILAPSSILSVGRLHADPLAGLSFFLFQLDLVRRSPGACPSVHRASSLRSAQSYTQIALSLPVCSTGFFFLRARCSSAVRLDSF